MKNLKIILKEVKLTELKGSVDSYSKSPEDFLKDLSKEKYADFFKDLKDSDHNKGVISFLRGLAKKKFGGLQYTSTKSAPCDKFFPTQSEIDAEKSLYYALIQPDVAEEALSNTGQPVDILDGPISASIGKGGKIAIVDGHHKWTQLYLLNPKAPITYRAIQGIEDPTDSLKAAQLGIMATSKEGIKQGKVGGLNLLKMSKVEVHKYVIDNLKKSVLQVFERHNHGSTPEEVAEYIWKNTVKLKTQNSPIFGKGETSAPPRSLMPQTTAKGSKDVWPEYGINPEKFKK